MVKDGAAHLAAVVFASMTVDAWIARFWSFVHECDSKAPRLRHSEQDSRTSKKEANQLVNGA